MTPMLVLLYEIIMAASVVCLPVIWT